MAALKVGLGCCCSISASSSFKPGAVCKYWETLRPNARADLAAVLLTALPKVASCRVTARVLISDCVKDSGAASIGLLGLEATGLTGAEPCLDLFLGAMVAG